MKIEKNLRKNKERKSANRRHKTLIKNHLKEFRLNLKRENFVPELKKMMMKTQTILDKAVSKGVIHKNSAARRKRKMHLVINKLEKKTVSEKQ